MPNPRVFFDIALDGFTMGRVIMELFADTAPDTAENFRALCTGERGIGSSGTPLHYKYSSIQRVTGFFCQGGDFDGKGGESIYGPRFKVENFTQNHTGPGILSMLTHDDNTNGSEFFIFFKKAPHLDGKHVVVGQVVSGMEVMKTVEQYRNYRMPIEISDCGELKL